MSDLCLTPSGKYFLHFQGKCTIRMTEMFTLALTFHDFYPTGLYCSHKK